MFTSEFLPLALENVSSEAARRKTDGWRFVQLLAVADNTGTGDRDSTVDLVYSYMKDGMLENLVVKGVSVGDGADVDEVASITDKYLSAFVFENEVHDLFGVHITNIAIDFAGHFYQVPVREPMTIISPEQKVARERAAKMAAMKAAKEKAEANGAGDGAKKDAAKSEADIEAKLAALPPEKAAKIRAAMEAKAAKEKAAQGGEASNE